MELNSFIIGTAGHIDHGKSTLVRALTGIDPDRLKEEKERGITIDIGFAHLYLDNNTLVSFVDVPGHEKFIKNMIAGAAGIDAVMLVVAANEAVKPQTIEHLRICMLLGLKKGFVALTKIDLVDEQDLEIAKYEIKELLKNTFLENQPIIPVSSVSLQGINDVKNQIKKLSQEVHPRPIDSYFRMPVDRAFLIKGFGLIVTGTVFEGIVHRNQELQIIPTFANCRVKNIQTHKQDKEFAKAGSRAALNLSGIDKNNIERGYMLVEPNVFAISNIIDAEVYIFNEFAAKIDKIRQLKLYHATSEYMCEVKFLDKTDVSKYYAQIVLQNPGLFLIDDRFILRTISPIATIGGGKIINIPSRKYKKKEFYTMMSTLKIIAEMPILEKIVFWIENSLTNGIRLSNIISKTGINKEKVLYHLSKNPNIKIISSKDELLISQKKYLECQEMIFNKIKEYQIQNPFEKGIQKAKLKSMYFEEMPNDLFASIISNLLVEHKIESLEDYLFIPNFYPELSQQEKAILNFITKEYSNSSFTPPSWKDIELKISDKILANKILQHLINKNEIVKIADDLFYHKSVIEMIQEKLINYFSKNKELEINQFKNMFQLSRKYAIPLLEYFDKIGFTIRVENKRKLRGNNL